METGTGKTYCYIKTIFELNKRYGWSKFIIVVPSIAIREGVYKSLEITAEHFLESYGKKARFFIYNSKQLHQLESFSSDAGINVMVINIQAFNATRRGQPPHLRGAGRLPVAQAHRRDRQQPADPDPGRAAEDGRRSRRMEALAKFKPLMILRYSATHKTHAQQDPPARRAGRLQPEAGEEDRRARHRREGAGRHECLSLPGRHRDLHKQAARWRGSRLEVKLASGEIKRVARKRLEEATTCSTCPTSWTSTGGFVVSEIDANNDTVEFHQWRGAARPARRPAT